VYSFAGQAIPPAAAFQAAFSPHGTGLIRGHFLVTFADLHKPRIADAARERPTPRFPTLAEPSQNFWNLFPLGCNNLRANRQKAAKAAAMIGSGRT
jgi:hypothetical protein